MYKAEYFFVKYSVITLITLLNSPNLTAISSPSLFDNLCTGHGFENGYKNGNRFIISSFKLVLIEPV